MSRINSVGNDHRESKSKLLGVRVVLSRPLMMMMRYGIICMYGTRWYSIPSVQTDFIKNPIPNSMVIDIGALGYFGSFDPFENGNSGDFIYSPSFYMNCTLALVLRQISE